MLLFIRGVLLKLLIFSCVSTESLCKMAKVNRGTDTEKKNEGQKCFEITPRFIS